MQALARFVAGPLDPRGARSGAWPLAHFPKGQVVLRVTAFKLMHPQGAWGVHGCNWGGGCKDTVLVLALPVSAFRH
jgi:hypothetical protein